jgi:GAF domain
MSDMGNGLSPGSADLQSALRADANKFPFRCELSLARLADFWTEISSSDRMAKGALAQIVGAEVKKAPELLGTIEDATVLEQHRELLDILMAGVFPAATWDKEYAAAMVPFQLRAFYASPSLQRLLTNADGSLKGRVNLEEPMVGAMRRAYAYALILKRVYGVELEVEYPFILTVADPETGLDRHFRLLFDWQFVDVETVGAIPPLTGEVRQRVHATLLDADRLRTLLPPEKFVFRGVTIFRALEVTDQEVLSALKRDLIDRESIVSNVKFMGLQEKLRTLFRRPDLRFGLAALDGDRVLLLNSGVRHEHGCIFADSVHHKLSEFSGSIYERTVMRGEPLIIPDLTTMPDRSEIEDQLITTGARGMMVAPLYYQGRIIGTIGLGSGEPDDFDATHLPKLQEVLPLFAMAVQRSLDEFNARIQTQIKERFTAIHPVVEWRFRKAVLDRLEMHDDGRAADLEPIVFEHVYPLYALADVRGSSTQRAMAIQRDLLAQLELARTVIESARQARALPALDELIYRIGKHAAKVEGSLDAGDELGVITFLRTDVEGLFDHLQQFGASVRQRIEAYRAALDPRLGVMYRQRRVFEEALTRVTETISGYLDLEEQAAQAIFPHYFEKQKTDGVDHQIYVGASLLEDGRFDPLYLKSLRLWQLMVACGVAARADRLTSTLPVPLETTHLILAQHTPLSIRFRFDEKRFDVDGAYNMRYEIIKKRIDKALRRGSTERVTQPGHLAIVYGHPAEAAEYRGYLEYLQHQSYCGGKVEDVELEELQGVSGLKALRVAVTLQCPESDRPVALDALSSAALPRR